MEIKDKRFANFSQYYIICVTRYVSNIGFTYQLLTNKHYKTYTNKDGNIRYREYEGEVYLQSERNAPNFCRYEKSYFKFATFKEAMDKAIELVRGGVLPNLGISKNICEYYDRNGCISILQRPIGDIVGNRYAKYLELHKNDENVELPRFVKGDVVYLTNIEDGDIIYKTKVLDCELNEEGEWQYYTSYWSEYPYTNVKSEEEFMEHFETKPSGNSYYYGQRCKVEEC